MTASMLPADDPAAIEQVAAALGRGEVVGVPTDTVYGLAVDPFRSDAVTRVFALKARPADAALPVLVGGWDDVELVAGSLPVSAQYLADRYWPGALTLVVPRRPGFTADLGGRESPPYTVGVRWPAHPVIQALCRDCGPLAVTSANRHGERPFTTARQVASAFFEVPPRVRARPGSGVRSRAPLAGESPGDDRAGIRVGVVLDGGTCDGTPSTVVECRGPASRCLRDGALPWSSLYPGSRGPLDRTRGGGPEDGADAAGVEGAEGRPTTTLG